MKSAFIKKQIRTLDHDHQIYSISSSPIPSQVNYYYHHLNIPSIPLSSSNEIEMKIENKNKIENEIKNEIKEEKKQHEIQLKKEISIKAKRDSANRDACQQLFLIHFLLSHGYTIILRKPRKKSKKSLQLFIIDRIINKSGLILFDINSFSMTSSDEKINRRNLDAFTNSSMISLVKNCNCQINIKKGKKAEKTSQFERIERIISNDHIIMYSTIKSIGQKMYNIVEKQLINNSFIFTESDLIN